MLVELCRVILPYVDVDERIEALPCFCQRLHLFNVVLTSSRIVVQIGCAIVERDGYRIGSRLVRNDPESPPKFA